MEAPVSPRLTNTIVKHERAHRAPLKGPARRPSAASRKIVAGGFAKPKEAAAYLGVSLKWVYQLVRVNGISHMRLGKRVVIPWSALHEYAATILKRGTIV